MFAGHVSGHRENAWLVFDGQLIRNLRLSLFGSIGVRVIVRVIAPMRNHFSKTTSG